MRKTRSRAQKDRPRCLMVACGSMLRHDGYTVHVWLALRAILHVQKGEPRPVLLSFESLRNWLRRGRVAEFTRQAETQGVLMHALPMLPKKLPRSDALNNRWCAFWVRRLVKRHAIGVVHAQSHMAAGAVSRALRGRPGIGMVFDVHGVDIEESLADGRLSEGSSEHARRLALQHAAAARADRLFAVSRALGQYMIEVGARRERIRVVPCVLSDEPSLPDLEERRAAARRWLGVGGRPVVLYLGSASPWQKTDLILAMFQRLRRRLPGAYLLVITGNAAEFRELARQQGIPEADYGIFSLPHKEVGDLACGADLGLLLRDDNLVNRVASPTKFAEYLAFGVPVAISTVLEDSAALVQDRRLGVVLRTGQEDEGISAAIEHFLRGNPAEAARRRQRCVNTAWSELSMSSVLPIYAEVYNRDMGDA